MRVAVFGCGVAGLTAAHELARLGHAVEAFEALPEPGGFFRSARCAGDGGMPSEYSWHGMGPWYHNVFDLLRGIPAPGGGSLYDEALSRPIDFGVFPDEGTAQFYDRRWRSIPAMFRLGRLDFVRGSWLMLKTWTARRRSLEDYAARNAAEEWGRVMGERAARTWRACFGPWIGSDWTRCSLHTAGHFFRKQLISGPPHLHRADAEGPAWRHGSGDGWLLFRAPSSEAWFEPWVRHLRALGVEFSWGRPLERLVLDGSRIAGGRLGGGRTVKADAYVLAVDPFSAAEIVARSPGLETDAELRRLEPLIGDGPHVQISCRLAWGEPMRFPRPRVAVVLADTEFNLTLFAQEQAWAPDVDLGDGVGSLWTCTSCVGTVPGRLHGLPPARCTREQFLEEVREQVLGCGSLDALVREANGGRSLREFPLLRMEAWHEWEFGPDGARSPRPKWVTTTRTQAHQPGQATSISNLLLAGAHTRTGADVWSIEGAVESGRRAARELDGRVPVLEQHLPWWLAAAGRVDDLCYAAGAPHALDLLVRLGLAGAAAGAML